MDENNVNKPIAKPTRQTPAARPLTEEEIRARNERLRRQQALRNPQNARPVQRPQGTVQGTPQRQPQQQRPAINGAPNGTMQRRPQQTPVQRPMPHSQGAVQGTPQKPVQQQRPQGQVPLRQPEQKANDIELDDELIPTGRKAVKKQQKDPEKLFIDKKPVAKKPPEKKLVEKKAVEKAEKVKAPESKAAAPKKKEKSKGSARAGADVMMSVTKAAIYMVVVVAISVFISVIAIRVGNDIFAFVKATDEIEITIPEDASVADVATILHDNGIINYPSVFKMYCSLKHEDGSFISGDYTVTPNMSYDQLRHSFKEQPITGTSWITIPEGYNVDDIIDLMVENGIGSREKYIDVINNYDFDYWFVKELTEKGISNDRSYRLEGYLFPDTYEFYNSSTEEVVINKLLKRFNEVYVEDFRTKAKELGYTTDQVLSIASYIQKEAKNPSDFMYVSSVIDNRLKSPQYPHLELDATIIYAIRINTGERKTTVTHEDTLYDSPYNTYKRNGLTPGPITNPGASAIRYALYPTDSNYYYYVSADNGTIYYASTEAEHNSNIEMVKQLNAGN